MQTQLQKNIALALLALLTTNSQVSTAHAQGTAFTYQGRLDSGGAPANGSYDLKLTLFGAVTNGNAIAGPMTNAAVAVSNGLFTTTVDFGSSVWNGETNWLQIGVETNGAGSFTALSPRQQLTPAPYAIFAEGANAAGLTGTIPMASLNGTYGAAVSLTNAGNSFFGNGAGLTGINAATLNGFGAKSFWQTGGNAGTTAGANFLGTMDNQPLELHVNGARALRVEPGGPSADWDNGIPTGAPNMIGGALINYVPGGVVGAVIAGGGTTNYGGVAYSNSVTADFGTIAGGNENVVSENGGTVGGGGGNTASGPVSTIGGGDDNTANSYDATVGGGEYNTAGYYGTVAGGDGNQATGLHAATGGGEDNTASGNWGAIPGGLDNIASAPNTFAAGMMAQAVNQGAFVWADSQNTPFSSTANNQFAVRAAGGVLFAADVSFSGGYHNLSMSGGNSAGYLYGSYAALGDGVHLGYNYYYDAGGAGHVINTGGATSRISVDYGAVGVYIGTVGGAPTTTRIYADGSGVTVYGTFNNSSDRNAKQGFAPVNPSEILEKVTRLPVSEWSYREDPKTRHVGPMGQDFYATFNIGTDEKHIAPIDEGGVALAAIQGLNQKLSEELKRRDAENAELKQRLDALEKMLLKQKPN